MTGTKRRLLPVSCLLAAGVLSYWTVASRAERAEKAGASTAANSPAPIKPVPAGERVDFNRDIQPILSDRCYFCHGPDAARRKGKLRFDVVEGKEGPMADRDNGPAIVPGKPEESDLVRRILSDDPDEKMPPPKSNRVLSPKEVDLLKRWVEQGAPFARHWSFVAPTRPPAPQVSDPAWCRNPIDTFVIAKLEREGLKPSREASKEALIRRVTLDLTGLPPTPAEVDAFLADNSIVAYEKVVDRLLASPHYGERMAWDWLDAARYADSNGYQGDGERTMWPWRDWVVQAFNSNMPYDQFTVWQLAGDLLPAPSGVEGPDATQEQKLATGFCRNHPINGEGGRIPEENRVEYVFDQLETVGTVWMGLTFNCTRCHDHKFDPLTKKDYYSLFAFFNQTPIDGGGGNPQQPPNIELLTDEQKAKLAKFGEDIGAAVKALDEREAKLFPREEKKSAAESEAAKALSDKAKAVLKLPVGKRSKAQLQELEKEVEKSHADYAKDVKKLRELNEQRDNLSRSAVRVMVMEDMPKPRKTFMLERGQYDKPTKDEVTADVPASLPPLPAGAPHNRLGLARWLVSAQNPLTARVTANRFWQQFFGVGLVKTPEDFGLQGEVPKERELLDWLAVEFRDPSTGSGRASGWDVKGLVRLIVTSATYRQSSRATPDVLEHDPDNRLMSRGPRFRMPSWMLRDQALAASGLLVPDVGGKPVNPYQPAGIWEEATFGTKKYTQDHGDALHRRSIYTFWRRIIGPTEFFDTAGRSVCTVKVLRTNSPLHALTMLNDVTYVEAARAMAERVLTTTGSSPEERVDVAFRLVLARHPTAEERAVLVAGVERMRGDFARDPEKAKKFLGAGEAKRNEKLDPVEQAAYAALCSEIMNLDEALTKE